MDRRGIRTGLKMARPSIDLLGFDERPLPGNGAMYVVCDLGAIAISWRVHMEPSILVVTLMMICVPTFAGERPPPPWSAPCPTPAS